MDVYIDRSIESTTYHAECESHGMGQVPPGELQRFDHRRRASTPPRAAAALAGRGIRRIRRGRTGRALGGGGGVSSGGARDAFERAVGGELADPNGLLDLGLGLEHQLLRLVQLHGTLVAPLLLQPPPGQSNANAYQHIKQQNRRVHTDN